MSVGPGTVFGLPYYNHPKPMYETPYEKPHGVYEPASTYTNSYDQHRYSQVPTTWQLGESQRAAGVYLTHPEKWPRQAAGWVPLRRSHQHVGTSRYSKQMIYGNGSTENSYEPAYHTLPYFQPTPEPNPAASDYLTKLHSGYVGP